MDNYLSLLGRGLTKRKKFISLGRLDMARQPRHPILTECSANDRFFPLKGEANKAELFNCLIV